MRGHGVQECKGLRRVWSLWEETGMKIGASLILLHDVNFPCFRGQGVYMCACVTCNQTPRHDECCSTGCFVDHCEALVSGYK